MVGWQLEKKVLAAVTAWFKRLDTRFGAGLEAQLGNGRGGADKNRSKGASHVKQQLVLYPHRDPL